MLPMRHFRAIAKALLSLGLILAIVAGAEAQSCGPVLTITGVESQAFPQVVAHVVAFDEQCWPMLGLKASDFSALEDDLAVQADSIEVEKESTQGVNLVLALDLSMDEAALSKIKEEARLFIDNALEPPDKVALLAFYEEMAVVQDFTDDKAALDAAIDGLSAQGSYTAFHDAIFESLTMLGTLPAGRKAVITFTNVGNNTGAHSADEVIEHSRSVGAPVYIFGFDRAGAGALEPLAAGTGGKFYMLSNLSEAQNGFQLISVLLELGRYKVTFRSGLKADNAEHLLTLEVTYKGNRAQGEGRFTAVLSNMTVSLPGLSDGQTVGGLVNLTAQVTAPSPVTSVEYMLDGRSLATADTAPYSFEWDSTTVEPGDHLLSARAIDQAGNEAQAEVSLKVIRPLAMTVYTDRAEIQTGELFTVTAKVESMNQVAGVDFSLDDKLLGSDKTPPYSFVFSSSTYSAGEHLVTVSAEDDQGWKAKANLPMKFQAPVPLSWWDYLLIAGAILALLGLLAAFIIGLLLIVREQRRRRVKVYRLEIANEGNIHSHYHLRVEEPSGALSFLFTLNGTSLPPVEEPVESLVVYEEVSPRPAPAARPQRAARTDGGGARQLAEKAKTNGGGARESAEKAMGKASVVAEIFMSIASILPSSMAASLEKTARPVYQAQSAGTRVKTTAGRVKGTADKVSTLSGQAVGVKMPGEVAGVKVPAQSPGGAAAPVVDEETAEQPVELEYRPVAAARPQTKRVVQRTAGGERWFQTPLLGPGETMFFDLLIAPFRLRQFGKYLFKLFSRSVEQEGAKPVIEEGKVTFERVSWLRFLLPYVIFTIMWITVVLLTIALFMALTDRTVLITVSRVGG